ncbi:mRNA stability protein [Penicillium canariense]|uniref:mRNA stability protein n=1 Tax=Penicillium canariense TaxID=189055 RepID=A0A9W9HX37_9EURO|nr:mRNA stability protein [Penicillium canariense]KAJ5160612.1 mRNA stability protein [Penicillium canariense]
MNPHQQNKVDINSLSPEEQRLLRLYGKMPTKKDLLQNKLKVRGYAPPTNLPTQCPLQLNPTHQERHRPKHTPDPNPTPPLLTSQFSQERKYFDSGDYALSKAGKASDVGVTSIGSRHPVPENIPHLTATSPGAANAATGGNGGSVAGIGQQMPGSISGHPGSVGFQGRSPMKEGSFLHRGSSLSEGSTGPEGHDQEGKEESVSPPPAREGVPIRR